MIGYFTGLDPMNPSLPPSGKLMYEVGDANTRYFVDEILSISITTEKVFILIKDLLKNGGTQQMMLVNFVSGGWIATDITIGSGSEFHIHMIASSPSANIDNFYFAGEA